MGLTEVLTIIFVVCKVIGIIDWSWWVVFSPTLIALAIYIPLFIYSVYQNYKIRKALKEFERF